LGFRWRGFITSLSLLMPAFSLLTPPRLGYPAASVGVRTLPYHSCINAEIRSFGTSLEPRYIIRARTLDQ